MNMYNENSFFEGEQFKKIMKYVYGWGGAIVIVGAMFKITHWPGATVMLVLGLAIEAVIFALSSFEPLHKDLDWAKVYPELDEDVDFEPTESVGGKTDSLDTILNNSGIDNEMLEKLGSGLKNLTTATENISNVALTSSDLDSFTSSMRQATQNISELSETSLNISSILVSSMEDTKKYEETIANVNKQMVDVNKNMSDLNTIYGNMLTAMSGKGVI